MPIIEVCRRLPDVTFYMISKTLRSHPLDAIDLLAESNFFLDVSEAAGWLFNAPIWQVIRRHIRVNTVYTLMPEETDFAHAATSDIVFNVSKAKKNIARYRAAGLALCPCDAKIVPPKGACGTCKLCHTKGGVKYDCRENDAARIRPLVLSRTEEIMVS